MSDLYVSSPWIVMTWPGICAAATVSRAWSWWQFLSLFQFVDWAPFLVHSGASTNKKRKRTWIPSHADAPDATRSQLNCAGACISLECKYLTLRGVSWGRSDCEEVVTPRDYAPRPCKPLTGRSATAILAARESMARAQHFLFFFSSLSWVATRLNASSVMSGHWTEKRKKKMYGSGPTHCHLSTACKFLLFDSSLIMRWMTMSL